MTPIRLRPQAERDALLQEHLETIEYVDPITGEPWVPEDLEDIGDEGGRVMQSETRPTMRRST